MSDIQGTMGTIFLIISTQAPNFGILNFRSSHIKPRQLIVHFLTQA